MITSLAMPFIRRLEPERAHSLALRALLLGLGGSGRDTKSDIRALGVRAMGLSFPNLIGIAAGFDKNAVAVRPLARIGFGFVEAGTVTPRPQGGNPAPRLFRLTQDRAIINRMGFNNQGIDKFSARLAHIRHDRHPLRTPVGANVGINKTGANPERDYPYLVGQVKHYADYIVINLSSPNTPGLRDLQGAGRLRSIIEAVNEAHPDRPPLLVKLAPDLAAEDIPAIVEAAVAAKVQGLIVSNTTISRPPGLQSSLREEAGGLSGRPLRALSTATLQQVARYAEGRLTLIGCGGIETGADIVDKLQAGADLVQLYSGFAYEGPAIIRRLKDELKAILSQHGLAHVSQLRALKPEVRHAPR